MLRFFYTALMHLLMPVVLARLWWRGRVEPGYREHIGERFGFFNARDFSLPQGASSFWIHAVSVGEVRAAQPLIEKWRAQFPTETIVLTCTTPTGRRMAEALFHDGVTITFLPYDLPWATDHFIKRIRPRALVVMETEIWPNLLATCHARRIPTFLVNARLSEKSRAGYAKNFFIRHLIRDAVGKFTRVLAQSDADAARLTNIGAKSVVVTGNVKFDVSINDEAIARGEAWKRAAGQRPIIVLASTREGEEGDLIAAFCSIMERGGIDSGNAYPNQPPLLVVVPRHPARLDEVAGLLNKANLVVARRSQTETPNSNIDAWLGDSMGEMPSYYAMCDVAIIGGSFRPLGGQNLIEAAALGKPIIMGPSTFNFSEAAQLAIDAGALIKVSDAMAAMAIAKTLLGDTSRLREMGKNAAQFAAAHRGATSRTLHEILTSLEANKR